MTGGRRHLVNGPAWGWAWRVREKDIGGCCLGPLSGIDLSLKAGEVGIYFLVSLLNLGFESVKGYITDEIHFGQMRPQADDFG